MLSLEAFHNKQCLAVSALGSSAHLSRCTYNIGASNRSSDVV